MDKSRFISLVSQILSLFLTFSAIVGVVLSLIKDGEDWDDDDEADEADGDSDDDSDVWVFSWFVEDVLVSSSLTASSGDFLRWACSCWSMLILWICWIN